MGYTRWLFAIDAQTGVQPLTRAEAAALHSDNFATPPGVPMFDPRGYLISEVEVRLHARAPTSVERVHLYVLPASMDALDKVAKVRPGVVAALRMALRRKLHGRAAAAQASAEEACNELERRLAEDDVDTVYRTAYGRLEEGSRRLSRRR